MNWEVPMMKSGISSEDHKAVPVATLIKDNLKRSWAVPVIAFIALFISGPMLYILTDSSDDETRTVLDEAVANSHIGFSLIFVFLSIAAGLSAFNYLQKKNVANFVHGLPVKREKLFAANYVSGLLMFMMPIAVNGLVMMMVSHQLKGCIIWILVSWLICAGIYSISVFAGVVSGSQFMHLFNSFFFNLLALMIVAAVIGYAHLLLYGYAGSELINSVIKNSTSVSALFGDFSAFSVIMWLLISIVVSLAALLAYRHRAIEDTGEALVFSWSKSLIIAIVTFLGTCLFGLMFHSLVESNLSLILGLVAGFIAAFVIISIMVYKSPKIFGRKNIITAAASALAVVLFAGFFAIDITGFEDREFRAEDTSDACLTSYVCDEKDFYNVGYRFDAAYFNAPSEPGNGDYGESKPLVFKDKDNIRTLSEMQRSIVETKDMEGEKEGFIDSAEFSFRMKNGKTEKRSYEYRNAETSKRVERYAARLFESDEFKDAYSLSNLRYKVSSVEVLCYVDSKYYGKLSGKEEAELIKEIDKDFRDMT
jgi:ABC-2 type transport system permease protein